MSDHDRDDNHDHDDHIAGVDVNDDHGNNSTTDQPKDNGGDHSNINNTNHKQQQS